MLNCLFCLSSYITENKLCINYRTFFSSTWEIISKRTHNAITIVVIVTQCDSISISAHTKWYSEVNSTTVQVIFINPLNAELNLTCHLLALLGAHHITHVSGLRVKFRLFSIFERSCTEQRDNRRITVVCDLLLLTSLICKS